MKKNKLLGIDLDKLIKESIDNLLSEVAPDESVENMKEKLKQQEMEASNKKMKKRMASNPKESASDEGEEATSEKPVQIKHEKLPEINVTTIRDKIDSIRSGRSLKDSATKNALKDYFQKLNGPERIALFAFLTGIDKILGDAAKNVKTPHAEPFKIDMEQDKEVETGKKPKSRPKGTKEISSNKKSETPIVVGEHADTTKIKKRLWSNK